MIEQQEQRQDTEITLSTGKLLVFFLIVVIVCGAFFGMGYSVGRNSTPLNPMNTQNAALGVSVSAGGTKPTAGTVAKPLPPDCATSAAGCVPAQNNGAATTATSTPQQPAMEGTTQPANTADPANSASPTQEVVSGGNTAAPELNGPSQSIMVQVAAVSKQEDAEALVSALRKKSYPVFMMASTGTDNLFHVQVGPFGELKDAEAMKSKLVGDGYNAIIKK